MSAIYSRFFANSRRSGFVPVASAAVGKFIWSRRISRSADKPAEARLLLSADDRIVVDGMNELYLFDRNGSQVCALPRWYGCQVALDDDRLAFTTAARKDRIQIVDLQGRTLAEDLRIPGLIDQSSLVLFEPRESDFYAQIQFAGDIHGAPPFFMVFKAPLNDPWFDWVMDVPAPSSPIIPLVNYEARYLATTNAGEILILDFDSRQREAAPIARFPFPLETATHWMSSAADGTLYFTGRGDHGIGICATDVKGGLSFVVGDDVASRLPGRPVAPPMLAQDRSWVLTTGALVCLQRDKLLWLYEAKETTFSLATALADYSVLVVAVNRLIRISPAGETMFDIVFEEELNTPPVVDATGRIYVASKEMLYAFD